MKLSFIFELILIFVLIAFAASAAIDKKHSGKIKKGITLKKNGQVSNKRQEATANRYCSCSTAMCNCCREFNIPVVALRGPGCATLQYLTGDRLAISMSFGERVLTNTTVSSKRADPICMPLPGGVTKFCGRVYNIGRKNENFNACLGLELRSSNEVEAAMRVSCFRFGPDGLKLEPPQPLPVVEEEDDDEDDDDDEDEDDDDDDDDFAFDDDDDDEEYDEDDGDDGDDGDDDSENDVDSDTFSLLDSDFIGGYFEGQGSSSSSGNKKRKATTTTTLRTPLRRKNVASTPTKQQLVKQNVKPVRKVAKPVQKVTTATTKKPTLASTNVQVSVNNVTLPENQNITMSLIMSPSVNSPNTPVDSTTASIEMSLDTTMITTTPNEVTTDTTIDEEEDDPLAEAVEDAITDDSKSDEEASEEDSDESSEASTEKTVDLTTAKTKINKKEEDGDVFDEIADGVAETMGVDDDNDDEDDSDENRKSS